VNVQLHSGNWATEIATKVTIPAGTKVYVGTIAGSPVRASQVFVRDVSSSSGIRFQALEAWAAQVAVGGSTTNDSQTVSGTGWR